MTGYWIIVMKEIPRSHVSSHVWKSLRNYISFNFVYKCKIDKLYCNLSCSRITIAQLMCFCAPQLLGRVILLLDI